MTVGSQFSTWNVPKVVSLNLAGMEACLVNLGYSNLGVLRYSPASSPIGTMILEGCRYETIHPGPEKVPAEDRLEWLARIDPEYRPGKYNQLAAAYHRAGHEPEAEQVVVAKLRARRETLSCYRRLLDRLADWIVLYGFRKSRALLGLLALVLVGTLFFEIAHPGYLVSTGSADRLPDFQPFVYALDVVIPVIDLRQQTFWVPAGGWVAAWSWLSIALGGALTTTAVIGMTGMLAQRD